ncbi:MAG TPA: serine/threonine-protein kinase [Blastocatellia bacterium]|nr:serine/threonine-protein kinase [Blastocatellia bacterium]
MNTTRQQTIFSKEYRIVDVIGEGGMGRVYRALQTSCNRVVAVKVLTASDPKAIQRALNEARIQQGLRHSNIVEFYEQVEWDGRPCLVMEYVEGVTLAEQLKRGAMPVAQALAVFRQVVSAVAYIHDHDIVHRDIKAANIRLTSDGRAKLLDFGIAKNELTPHLTQTGFVVGTVEYLAPEQINSGRADERSDIWALGVLLFEMVTGKVPFTAKTFGTLYQQINRASFTLPPELPIPRNVAKLIARCLKKDPADRFQSAAELLAEVRHASAPSKHHHTPHRVSHLVAAAQQSVLPSSSRRRPLLLLALLAALILAWNNLYVCCPNTGHSIRIEPADGPAELFVDGTLQGTTPLDLPARVGEPIRFKLQRGNVSKEYRFTVTSNMKSWSEPLQTGF